jgi:hypothetical protein
VYVPGGGTEIIPAKDFHTRIQPLALASGHGRYITVTPKRTILYIRICNRFTSETVT